MKFNVIASGSKGNATVIVSKKTKILLDFGISKKRVEHGLEAFSLSLDDIDAFVFTHEHSDHISNAFNIASSNKVYGPIEVLNKLGIKKDIDHIIKPYKEIIIGDFSLLPLPLSHDANETYGYVIKYSSESLVYITDTGLVTEKNLEYIKNLNYIILESNYDEEMLFNSNRPSHLIKRIISDKGHLSNKECGYYLSQIIGPNTSQVILGHISQDCNKEEIALSTIKEVILSVNGFFPDDISFFVAGQEKEIIGGKDED